MLATLYLKQKFVLNFNVAKYPKKGISKIPAPKLDSHQFVGFFATSPRTVCLWCRPCEEFELELWCLTDAEVLIIEFFQVLEVENSNFVLKSVNIDNVKSTK